MINVYFYKPTSSSFCGGEITSSPMMTRFEFRNPYLRNSVSGQIFTPPKANEMRFVEID